MFLSSGKNHPSKIPILMKVLLVAISENNIVASISPER